MNATKNNGVVNIRGKEYHLVSKRVKDFRDKYPITDGWGIQSKVVSQDEKSITVCCSITKDENVVATGIANEKFGSNQINKTSAYENAETSAVGRALAFAGFGSDGSLCSAEELASALNGQQDQYKVPSWLKEKVGYQRTGDLTWQELIIHDLPDGKCSREFLKGITKWKEASEDYRRKSMFLLSILGN